MTEARPANYWMSSYAIYIQLNAAGDYNYIHANCSSGSVIMCHVDGINELSYDSGHNYRRWQLTASPTVFHDNVARYVYIAIPKSAAADAMAVVVFPSEKIDIYGKNAKGEQIGSTDYYYIFTQGIISDSYSDGGSHARTWTQEIDTGTLASDEALASGGEGKWWDYNSSADTVKFLKAISEAIINKLTSAWASIKQLVLNGHLINGVSSSSTPVTSDDTLVTPKYGEEKWLSKTHDDVTEHKLTMGEAEVKKDLTVGEFVKSLYDGKGAGIDKSGNAEVESLRVRSSLDVLELIINRLSALEGDQLLTESDTIDTVTKDDDGTYTLQLKSKWEGYFTAQAENNVLKGIMNTLAKGSGEYHTAWFRVNSVNTVSNSINISMYPDNETPAGKNFPPEEMMKIARWGNQTDTTRQSCLYLSSTEGRIVKLVNVTKPIIDKENYGATLGSLPDFVRTLTDDNGNLLPIREGLDYLYAPGIVTMDIIRLNKWTLKRIPTYVDRGKWTDGEKYYCEAENPATGEYETSDVWYYGCKWRCCKNLTTTAPAWNNTDWAMVEGNPDFTVEFADTDYLFDPDRFAVTLTIIAKLHNIDVTADILNADVIWTRYSEDDKGVERVASDNAWALKRAGAGKSINLTAADVDFNGYVPRVLRYTATVTLRDGMGEPAATESVSFEF